MEIYFASYGTDWTVSTGKARKPGELWQGFTSTYLSEVLLGQTNLGTSRRTSKPVSISVVV